LNYDAPPGRPGMAISSVGSVESIWAARRKTCRSAAGSREPGADTVLVGWISVCAARRVCLPTSVIDSSLTRRSAGSGPRDEPGQLEVVNGGDNPYLAGSDRLASAAWVRAGLPSGALSTT
jgi:hypothetical protein